MRIKKIEIEGFKSYSQREVVANLDKEFNAITGLNGSGKSNILDAICFLLGITNLAQVRAHSLNDLVYKQGQAGINRATVTITFENNMPNELQSVGYDKDKYKEIIIRRQIIINGKNTYQINGVSATNQRVSDLFKLVGINVNNPHFLIMQGRITKVLNMKPMEILSMVEEAAGVRMYESKKQSAIRTIDKKDHKLKEISRLIDDDINPSVERLKKERANYLEFQQIERELETLQRKLISYDYHNSKLQSKDLERKAAIYEQEAREIDEQIEELSRQVKAEQETLKQMEAEKAKNMGPELSRLDNALKQKQNEQAKAESERDEKDSNLAEMQMNMARKEKSLESDKKDLAKKQKQLEQAESEIGGEEQRGKAAEESVVKARQKLEALAKGMMTDDDGNAVTLEARLTAMKSKHTELRTDIQKAELNLGQLNENLAKKRRALQSLRVSSTDPNKKKDLEAEIVQLERQIQALNFDADAEKRLEQQQKQLAEERRRLTQELEKFEDRHHNLQFNYNDPYRGFDRNKVKGVVANLFRMLDSKYATALEVVAGGKLYNIVIDKAETGKALLQAGLQKRVTMLPLDKINAHGLNQRQIDQAKRLVGEENVFYPNELIAYAPELERVMLDVFGNCLICSTMDQAKRLAYDRSVGCRTVTISGEDFRPNGLLTGGFRRQDTSVLKAINDNSGNYDRLRMLTQQLDAIQRELDRLNPIRRQFNTLNETLINRKKQLERINEELKNSPVEQLRAEIAHLETEIVETNEIIAKTTPEISSLAKKIDELESRKKNEKAFQENEKKKAQKELADAQKEIEQLKGTFSKIKESLSSLREEIATLEQSIEDEIQDIDQLKKRIETLREEIAAENDLVMEAKEKVRKAQQELDEYNKELRMYSKSIQAKTTEIEELKKQTRQLESKQNSKGQDAAEAIKNSKEFDKRTRDLEKSHNWIAEEKKHFGVAGTAYDFQNYSYEVGKRELDARKARSKELLQTVNPKAMHLLGTAEDQLKELVSKREQLERDKQKLFDAIEQLDEKKRKTLLAAHKQISTDFGSIYSTLLPGASAELIPPSGHENCLNGLEVKIAFNGKYKDSLAELSGGQRSLVALSLILAMLKFKPAPFYILDEIDAALDISHTENIGKMIKNHFSQSQFIVVSLKQGFFDNANVVYTVNFRDGRSVVTRTENKH